MALPSSRLLASLPQSGQGILEHQHVVKKEEVGVLPPKTTVVQHRGFPDQKREQEVDSAAAEDFQHLMQNLHLDQEFDRQQVILPAPSYTIR
ncbi:unnamed protein product [Durusdinium trenchii]|uniref:Uncharacterized protein n=1 Tax=Durusdinium trenchii TaxID=1381693 RepID=A0ABP0JZE1_9DINO